MPSQSKSKIPEPRLIGERVILHLPKVRDAAAIVDFLRRNKSFHRPTDPIRPKTFYTEAHWKKQIPRVRRMFRRDVMVQFMLSLKEEPSRIIGIITFSQIARGSFQACYLGYAIDRKEEGKGLMTEAVRLGGDYMFREKCLHLIMANYMPRNAKSARVLEKLGFRIDGLTKEYLLINGRWEDHVLTSLVNPNWRAGMK